MPHKKLPELDLKGFRAMMLPLFFKVDFHRIEIRLAHREGTESFLPREVLLIGKGLFHPAGRL